MRAAPVAPNTRLRRETAETAGPPNEAGAGWDEGAPKDAPSSAGRPAKGPASPRPATDRSRRAPSAAGRPAEERNPGMPLDLDWVRSVRVNRSAAERRAASLVRRRSVKAAWQAGWLLRAVALTDLTTLAGDDTPGRVRRLCGKARRPVRADVLDALGVSAEEVAAAAACVHPAMTSTARDALEGSAVKVAAVAAGFPSGLSPFGMRVEEVRAVVADGAQEVDIVIDRSAVLAGDWERLWQEVAAFRDACGDARLKVILATGELGTLAKVAQAALVAMMAGADFVKTSTGKEAVNATLPVGLVMARSVREYFQTTGCRVGLKAAGGLRTARDALAWLVLVKEELGDAWMVPALFRIGASTLLADVERQLEHHATGRYSAFHRHALG